MSVPSSTTDPESAALGTSSCIRLRILKKVDFPQPEGPIRAVTLRGSIFRLTRSRTLLLPNQALTLAASRDAGPAGTESFVGLPGGTGDARKSVAVMGELPRASRLATKLRGPGTRCRWPWRPSSAGNPDDGCVQRTAHSPTPKRV